MSEFRSIGDIMQDYVKDLKSGKAQEEFMHGEQSYRRGYHHAYHQAIEDIFKLLEEEHMSNKDTYALASLQSNLIGVWRTENFDRFIPPPRFSQGQLVETLEHRRNLRRSDEE